MDERRKSCCDEIIDLGRKVKTHCTDIKELKTFNNNHTQAQDKLKKWVYGAIVLPSLLIAFSLGLRSDIKEANAIVSVVKQRHEDDYRKILELVRADIKDLDSSINSSVRNIGVEIGINRANNIKLSAQIDSIDKKLDEINKWMKEQK